jgi:NNP family nitrate/nitrite transporter-like MFS transporter
MFGGILDWLGVNSSCFMLLYGIVWVSLILIYFTEVRRAPAMGEAPHRQPGQSIAAASEMRGAAT